MSRTNIKFPKDLPPMGIYSILCVPSARVYVGQSRRIRGRWMDHVSSLAKGDGSPRLQREWDTYGPSQFEFNVLEAVEDARILDDKEQFYLDALGSGNMTLNTLSQVASFAGYIPDAEARAKIGVASRNRSAETKARYRATVQGRTNGPLSQDHRQKISVALKGVPHGPMTPENREAISKALSGKPQSPARVAAASKLRGVPRTDEVRRKMSEAKKGKPFPEAQRQRMLGRKLSDDHRAAMSKGRKGVPWTQARRDAQAQKMGAK